MSKTPTLDEIAAKGNRGHYGHKDNNHIICVDGTVLSVIAGGGTYSAPKPDLCACAHGAPYTGLTESLFDRHDYPGPYSMVEVLSDDPELIPDFMGEYDGEPQAFSVHVETVREYILKHGGEWHADGADDFLLELTKESGAADG